MPMLAGIFFLTALVYSAAGFGGGSTYIAMLVLFDAPMASVRSVALMCNIAVVAFGTYQFARCGHLQIQKVLPFVITSVPMAWWGGTFQVQEWIFHLLLAVSLAIAAARMLWINKPLETDRVISPNIIWSIGLPTGAMLGFLSGLIGIGGGIYLAPLLLLSGFSNVRQTAAASSFFILVNSIAGLGGQSAAGMQFDFHLALPLLAAVLAGGQIGSRLGSGALPKVAMQRLTGLLIALVAGRLFWNLM